MGTTSGSTTTLARGATHISKRLILSYVFDWVCILGIAGVGGAFNRIKASNHRTFVLQDPSISYPNLKDTVSATVLVLVSLVAPAAITFILTFLFVPGAGAPSGTPRSRIWRRKLWEWNTAWMGLALALASAFMITEGLKDLAGKPRPHMLATCNPDLTRIAEYQVGGLGDVLQGGAVPIMVDYHICQETDGHALRDMFASWPSGHSSFSWAGLLYLTLWASAKFAVTVPYLSPSMISSRGQVIPTFEETETKTKALADGIDSESTDYSHAFQKNYLPPRNQAAAPPVYLLIIVFVPLGTAMFIAVSRWFDYHHHGFDIISGSLIGIVTAWFSFSYYHLPIRRGAGWSWGARSRSRAFWLGVGRDTYVGDEGWMSKKHTPETVEQHTDIESGKMNSLNNAPLHSSTDPGPSAM